MLNIRDVGSAHRYLLSWSDIHGFVVSSIHNILRPAPQKLNVVAPMRRVDYRKILAQGADWTARYAYELESLCVIQLRKRMQGQKQILDRNFVRAEMVSELGQIWCHAWRIR